MFFYRHIPQPWQNRMPELWKLEQQMMQKHFPKSSRLEYSSTIPYWTVRKSVQYADGTEEVWTLAAMYTVIDDCPVPVVVPVDPSWKRIRSKFPNAAFYTVDRPDLNVKGIKLPDEGQIRDSLLGFSHYYAADALTLAYQYLNYMSLTPAASYPYQQPHSTSPAAPQPTGGNSPHYSNSQGYPNPPHYGNSQGYPNPPQYGNSQSHTEPPRAYPEEPPAPPRMYRGIQMMPADMRSPECRQLVLSDRAFRSILAETSEFGDRETGGLMLGNFHNGFWYVIDAVDPGFATVNHPTAFEYQVDYVNHLSRKISRLYNHPLTIVGIWHRHPGSMDTFSATDYASMESMVATAAVGLIFMLVNVDPKLRMSFYYLNKQLELFRVPWVVGDAYIPGELSELAPAERLSYYHNIPVEIAPIAHPDPRTFPQSIADLDRLTGTQNSG